jgi:hypothetical protein
MNISKLGTMTAAILTVSAASTYAQSLTLNYGPLGGSDIVFGGSAQTFNFTQGTVTLANPLGNQFGITTESGSANTGSALGLQGNIFNGPFSYGTISSSTIGPITTQTANVISPTGTLDIYDGLGGTLSGTVNFIEIATINSGGQLNGDLDFNVTGVTYNGTNPDLAFVKANQPGQLTLSFQFSPGENLEQLSTGPGGAGTSYNGSITVVAVPEPTTLAMSGLGALAALGLGYRSRKNS